jgi:hypothetical protein
MHLTNLQIVAKSRRRERYERVPAVYPGAWCGAEHLLKESLRNA